MTARAEARTMWAMQRNPTRMLRSAMIGATLALAGSTALAQPADPPCTGVEGLFPERIRLMPRGARCRLDPAARRCMPGLTLGVDAKGERDLCLSRDGRPVQRPTCDAGRARVYEQKLHGLTRGVRLPEGTPVRFLAQNAVTSRREILVQRPPVVGPGPDTCAFARALDMVFTPPKTKDGSLPQPPQGPPAPVSGRP